jgi:hypothetical protein
MNFTSEKLGVGIGEDEETGAASEKHRKDEEAIGLNRLLKARTGLIMIAAKRKTTENSCAS